MECKLCPLCGNNYSPAIGAGNPNAEIMLISGSPASEKDNELLYNLLNKAGINKDDIYSTNVVLCKFPKNDDKHLDSKIAVKKCPEIYLIPDILRIQPKIIIILGNIAHRYFFHSEGILSKRGVLKEWNGFKVLPTLHPAFLLKGKMHHKDDVISDLKYAKSLLTEKVNKVSYTIVTNDNFNAAIKLIKSKKKIGCDLETTGLKAFSGDVIIGIGIAVNRNEAYYFPYRKEGFLTSKYVKVWNEEQEKQLVELFELPNMESFHNANFDCEFLEVDMNVNIDDNYVRDSLILAHLLDENRSNKLEYLTDTFYPDMAGYKKTSKTALSKIDNYDFSKIPVEVAAERCSLDAIACYRLTDDLTKELKKDTELWDYYQRFQLPLRPMLRKIQRTGFRIDATHAAEIDKKYKHKLDKLTYDIWESAGYRFNVNSPKQLLELFANLKFPVVTIKEKVSTGKDALLELKKKTKHPIIDLLIKHRKLSKLYTTYVLGLPLEAVNGLIHCKLSQTVTTTGRLASRLPNQQNLAGDEDIKNMVCAKEGYTLIEADEKQAEVRILSYCSKDKKLLEACTSSDIYIAMASLMFNIPYEEVTKEQRSFSKTCVLGTLYGMGPKALAAKLGVGVRKAEEIQNKFFSTFKDAQKFIKETKRLAHLNGYVRTVYGRIRHLPQIRSSNSDVAAEAERQAVNSLIQSATSDFVTMALRRVDDALKDFDGKIIITVHDSIVVEIKDEQVDSFIPVMIECMSRPVMPIDVPMAVDIEIGKSWGSLKKYVVHNN
ncbi:hypothetical protein D4R86_01500 [bacterium]|nr:MAG: hypothetical protein D4R86_01500 [bacterium]